MEILSVFHEAFRPYGKVITGMEDACKQVLEALAKTAQPAGVAYTPEEPTLQNLPAADIFRDNLFGGIPVQLGCCNGHNTKLNCLEYHRNSEFNLGCEDFILLIAKQEEIEDGFLDTAKVKAFRVPKGVLVECYATTLHFAPCHADAEKGFRVLILLPKGTNGPRPTLPHLTKEDRFLWKANKWLLAHPDSKQAAEGAPIGLKGKNIDLTE